MITRMTQKLTSLKLTLAGLLLASLAFGLALVIETASARGADAPAPAASPLHPDFALLDVYGANVLESGAAISTMQTCGQCHDTDYIVSHSFHADLGLSDYSETSDMNAGNGSFGSWNPLTYRYLSQSGDSLLDMSTTEWLMRYGDQVAGGGPATTSRGRVATVETTARRSSSPTASATEVPPSISTVYRSKAATACASSTCAKV